MKDRIEAELALAREIRAAEGRARALARASNSLADQSLDEQVTAKTLQALRAFLFPKEAA